MQAKQYQQRVLDTLDTFLTHLDEHSDIAAAFSAAQEASDGEIPKPYNHGIDGVPQLTYKVPTGGGKTFLAAASLKRIMESMPAGRPRVVVWLVPRDAILTQTLKALRDETHPYRQRLNRDFQGRVEVYSKDELLAGQNFTAATIADQLSVMVLSYDSFRSSGEGLRAYEENGALMSFTNSGRHGSDIPNAHPNSLFQVINNLNPVVIVDESHRATSPLSRSMLRNFNPAFTLSLTATPNASANILVFVRATELKAEQMVKLPVLVVNRTSQTEVIGDTIDLRVALERQAKKDQESGAAYCRPIALIQAEPKGEEDALTFEALRKKLHEAQVPLEHIAIKTATIDELVGVDLLSPDCPIRYIITVNALVEGWDCPFAYILAALANKNSAVNVEQVVGRILRQPHARQFPSKTLNMSYVLTASNKFETVVTKVVSGLNSAGFTRDDVRIDDAIEHSSRNSVPNQVPHSLDHADSPADIVGTGSDAEGEEGVLDFDSSAVAASSSPSSPEGARTGFANILHDAATAADEYQAHVSTVEDAELASEASSGRTPAVGSESSPRDTYSQRTKSCGETVARKYRYMMNAQFVKDAITIKLPQFVQNDRESLLIEAQPLLEPATLSGNLRLRGRDTILSLGDERESFRTVDVNDRNVPTWSLANSNVQSLVSQHLHGLPDAARMEASTALLVQALDSTFDSLPSRELQNYVKRVVEDMNGDERVMVETKTQLVVEALRSKIRSFVVSHSKDEFRLQQETGAVTAQPRYVLPQGFNFSNARESIEKSLYEGEDSMNKLEGKLATRMSSMDNIRWWHRNPSRTGFRINGFINHYPDFIVRTESDRIVLVETKSGHLNVDDSRQRLDVGMAWAHAAGVGYHYFMVFDDGDAVLENSYEFTAFLGVLERL